MTKYVYVKVIQQNYGSYSWEDVSEYPCLDSNYFLSSSDRKCLREDFANYSEMGYPTRIIRRINKRG